MPALQKYDVVTVDVDYDDGTGHKPRAVIVVTQIGDEVIGFPTTSASDGEHTLTPRVRIPAGAVGEKVSYLMKPMSFAIGSVIRRHRFAYIGQQFRSNDLELFIGRLESAVVALRRKK